MSWSADNSAIFRPGCPTAPRHDKFLRDHFLTVPMKFRLLGAGIAIAASLLAPQQARAIVATTKYVPFKIYQNDALNPTINFTEDFAAASGLSVDDLAAANLTGLGFKIAGAVDGTGSATVGGNPRAGNSDDTLDSFATIDWAPKFSFGKPATPSVGPITGTITGVTPVNCVPSQTCGTPGGSSIPAASFRVLNLTGNNYAGSGGFASITSAWKTGIPYSTSETANFTGFGTPPNLLLNFDPPTGGLVADKPFIQGFIAIQYEYTSGQAVPGPLPLMGAAAAFGWSRRLKKRISSVA